MANQILSMNKLKEVLPPFGVVLDYVGVSVNLRWAMVCKWYRLTGD